MPASVSAGDLLLVALKMPPSRIGTYSNFTPVRFSIAGIASWLRKALGLPKSNRNCGFELTTVSQMFWCIVAQGSPRVHGIMTNVILWNVRRTRVTPSVGAGAQAHDEGEQEEHHGKEHRDGRQRVDPDHL